LVFSAINEAIAASLNLRNSFEQLENRNFWRNSFAWCSRSRMGKATKPM